MWPSTIGLLEHVEKVQGALRAPCITHIFGPGNPRLPAFGPRPGRCLEVRIQIFAKSVFLPYAELAPQLTLESLKYPPIGAS